jgi:hypothetical protein
MKAINANSALVTGSMALSEYVEIHYMPWVESNDPYSTWLQTSLEYVPRTPTWQDCPC